LSGTFPSELLVTASRSFVRSICTRSAISIALSLERAGIANHFQPTDRRNLRLKLMVKRRHKPISRSEIVTIADHGSQKKMGSKQRLSASTE
jgi:hypothetical protein